MATFVPTQSFIEAAMEKKHNLATDQLVVFLTTNANAPSASADNVLADVTEIAYTNLSSRNITTTSSSQTTGTYKLVLQDLVLTASGNVATFRWVGIYNDTAANDELIGWYDHGSDVTMVNGNTFTVNFDDSNGLFQAAFA